MVEAARLRGPKAVQVLEEGEKDALVYMVFPRKHWTRIYSTNPLERVNKEIKCRADVVTYFPTRAL